MSAQYRDGSFKPNLSQYDTIGQINDCVNCPEVARVIWVKEPHLTT